MLAVAELLHTLIPRTGVKEQQVEHVEAATLWCLRRRSCNQDNPVVFDHPARTRAEEPSQRRANDARLRTAATVA